MGKISDNGVVYMTIITSDMGISKKTNQLLLTYQFKFIGLYLPELGWPKLDIQVDAKKRLHNVLLERWMEK